MLTTELMASLRRLELKAEHLASAVLSGEFASAYKGRGWDFEELRVYHAGDDLRRIDWNVTARTGQAHVKVYREERELTVMLLVDVSPSQTFGGQGRSKRERSAELAAILAFLASKQRDKVGLILFSDHIERYILPGQGRAHIWTIMRSVLGHEPRGRQTSLEVPLRFLLQVRKRRCLSFLLSDFWTPPYEAILRPCALRHELVCLRILDSFEMKIPDVGLLWLQDLESRETRLIPSSSPSWQAQGQAMRAQERREWEACVRKAGAEAYLVSSEETSVAVLHRYLRARERRRRHG